jgi:hypothetical protein
LEQAEQKTPIQIEYLPTKFKLDLPTILVQTNINNENYQGYILLKQQNLQLPIS